MKKWPGGQLRGKTILILSPQSWGKMYISKHHYAIELAKRGNKVFFLNPPNEDHKSHSPVAIKPIEDIDGLYLITHKLSFPYKLKFHAIGIFHFLMRWHVKKILKKLQKQPDIIWSFDLNNIYPFAFFGRSPLKIFHPVDEPLNKEGIEAANGADIIFSVTSEILSKYNAFQAPKYFINHGVSSDFLHAGHIFKIKNDPIRVGYAGNLLRKDIDQKIFLRIIDENPDLLFECWGSYTISQSNIGGHVDAENVDFVTSLQAKKNVILYGAVPSGELAGHLMNMDAFLVCYDIKKDQSAGTNYHKILEYLSTGKIIIANNITTYTQFPGLLEMIMERDNNETLPNLFREVTGNLEKYNSKDKQEKRIHFAFENSYVRQINKIEELVVSI